MLALLHVFFRTKIIAMSFETSGALFWTIIVILLARNFDIRSSTFTFINVKLNISNILTTKGKRYIITDTITLFISKCTDVNCAYRRCRLSQNVASSRSSIDSPGILFKSTPFCYVRAWRQSQGNCLSDWRHFPLALAHPLCKIDDPFHIFSYVYIPPRAEQSKMKR